MDKHFFQTTGLNQSGHYKNIPFAQYIETMRDAILCARHFVHGDQHHIADLCSPFSMSPQKKSNKGIILIHGLLETPYSTRDLATQFIERSFEVRSVLLPGHGTVPGDLLTVEYQAWIDIVKYAVKELQKSVDHIYLCGLSTGGLVAINEALDNDNIRGLFLVAPAMQIKSRFAALCRLHKSISWAIPRAKWLSQFKENDNVKYLSTTMNAGAQVYQLGKLVHQRLMSKQLNLPLWMALTADDETIDTPSALAFFQQQKHPENKLLLFTNQKNCYKTHNIECIKSAVPDEGIVNLSHVGMAISPENDHYGKNGDYTLLCRQQILAKRPRFGAINDAEKIWREVKDRVKLNENGLYRLHYNPSFNKLIESLNGFIISTSQRKEP